MRFMPTYSCWVYSEEHDMISSIWDEEVARDIAESKPWKIFFFAELEMSYHD